MNLLAMLAVFINNCIWRVNPSPIREGLVSSHEAINNSSGTRWKAGSIGRSLQWVLIPESYRLLSGTNGSYVVTRLPSAKRVGVTTWPAFFLSTAKR